MHKARSLLGLALASSVTALGLIIAAPGTAVGMPTGPGTPERPAGDTVHSQLIIGVEFVR